MAIRVANKAAIKVFDEGLNFLTVSGTTSTVKGVGGAGGGGGDSPVLALLLLK